MSLLSAIEPLRVANRLAERQLFRWQILSETGDPVYASNEMSLLEHQAMLDVAPPRNLLINSSFHPEKHLNQDTANWINGLARQGAIIGALDTGCYLLAQTDLLEKRIVTLHWEAVPAFEEAYPYIEVSNELFEIDDKLITCAGGTAATDMMLHIIQQQCGTDLAIDVCEQFIKNGIRQKSDKQRLHLSARLNVHHPRLIKVLTMMEENPDYPLTTEQLANRAHLSVRQLERLFRQHLDSTPTGYYLKLRLERAGHMLQHSELTIAEIASACGFNSSPHFCRSFRNHFEMTPGEFRRKELPIIQ